MPRIRSVHPDICDDETLAEVTAYAERTFIRLWTHLDDKGRGVDNAKLWKGKLYPLHDDVTTDRVERDLAELTACGLLIRYVIDGKRYLCAKPETWAKYQKPQHPTPSKLPEPHAPSRNPHEASPGSSSGVEGRCIGEEGESEGEPEQRPAIASPVDKPLAQRVIEISSRFPLSPGQSNPAASGDCAVSSCAALTSGGRS